MSDIIKTTYPNNLILKSNIGEFILLNDYPEDRAGNNVSFNPWKMFLAAILNCQSVNLAKYCKEYGLNYSNVEVELVSLVENNNEDMFPEYHIKVDLPEDFPANHIEPMVAFFNDCPVANHLTKFKPILKTFINNELASEHKRT